MSKAKTIYRYSFVGEALRETISQLSDKIEFSKEDIEEMMIKFDKVLSLL